MLVINNGVPKSGTTMFQKIIRQIRPLEGPSSDWHNSKWTAPSIEKNKLLEYINIGEWKERDIIIKQHQRFVRRLSPIVDSDIRIFVSYRFIPDAVLSRFYHEVRHNRASLEDKMEWLSSNGREYAKNSLKYRISWQDKPNVLMVSYDDTMNDPLPVIKLMSEHLNTDLAPSKLERIAEKSIKRLKPGQTSDVSKHVRSPGVSTSKQEMSEELFAEFCQMEQEAQDA